jgi:hypothetical protein
MYNQEFQRPREVGIAVKLLWGATAILWVWILFRLIETYRSTLFENQVVIMSGLNSVLYIILLSLMVLMISNGRNWARVVLLAICILGLLIESWSFVVIPEPRLLFPNSLMALAILWIWSCSLFLLFTRRASIWFRRR